MSRVDDKYLKLLKARYSASNKKEKGKILDEFVKTTGYGRKYATALLNGKRSYVPGVIRRPHASVLASSDVSEEHKDELRAAYAMLDLVDLRRQFNVQAAILDTAQAR